MDGCHCDLLDSPVSVLNVRGKKCFSAYIDIYFEKLKRRARLKFRCHSHVSSPYSKNKRNRSTIVDACFLSNIAKKQSEGQTWTIEFHYGDSEVKGNKLSTPL